jgi:preprotein translocase subunit SecD
MSKRKQVVSIILLCSFLVSSTAFAGQHHKHLKPVKFQVVKASINISKQDIQDVKLIKNPASINSVAITLTPAAGKKLENLSENNINREMQFVVGKRIVSSATIRSSLSNQLNLTFKSNEMAKKVFHALKDR